MSADQIEYCGECPHYTTCLELAAAGRLIKCKANKDN